MSFVLANVLPVPWRRIGNQKKAVYTITFTGTYTSEGESIPISSFGINAAEYVEAEVLAGNGLEATPMGWATYTTNNQKLHLFNGKTSAELAGGTTITGVVVRVEAFG